MTPRDPAPPRPSPAAARVFVADVGNSRIKLAALDPHGPGLAARLDLVARELAADALAADSPATDALARFIAGAAPGAGLVLVGSVNVAAAARLEEVVARLAAARGHALEIRFIGPADLPLEVRLAAPDRVGIDRLAAAAAVARLERGRRPAVIVDCGTAATVGCVTADGAFLGGAIFPGPTLLARALATGTSLLPEVHTPLDAPPPLPGRSTTEAITVGIGWGLRGAIRTLVDRSRDVVGSSAALYLTGGGRGMLRDTLPEAIERPDLVLEGLALAAHRHAPA
ncbi:MAG: type III pantothenate kinase [Planctomycetota bacterium]